MTIPRSLLLSIANVRFATGGDTPHRYWKFFADVNTGDSGYTTIAELGLYPTSSGGTNLLTIASSVTSRTPPFSGSLPQMWDGNFATTAQWNQTDSVELDIDFGSGSAYDIGYVKIACQSGSETAAPNETHLEWSDDGVTYTRQWFQVWITYTDNTFQTATRPTGTTGTQWRVVQGDTSDMSAAEITMASSTGGSNLCTNSALAFAHDSFGAQLPDLAFDGNPSTIWSSSGASQGAWVNWIGYNFGTAETITEITWQDRNSFSTTQNPETGSVQFSNDGTAWLEAWSWTGATWTAGQILTFDS